MTKLMQKISVGLTTATLLGASFATSAFASAGATIDGNGANSTNVISLTNYCSSSVSQTNSTNVGTFANVTADTGGNKVEGNTGGDSSITTGDATAGVSVTVEGGSNSAEPASCCSCLQGGSADATISDNGTGTSNVVTDSNKQKTKVTQKTKTKVLTFAKVKAKTGDNKLKNNTGNGSSVDTGSADAGLQVDVTAGSNSTP